MQPKASILLVDDQPRNLEVLCTILESPDYELVKAESADEALLALLNGDFAAIVTDIRMPGISGLELAQIIKQRRRTEAIPILFMTAHLLDETDVLRGYSVGAVDYLSKPVNPEILRSKIAVFVELSRKNRALAAVNLALQREVKDREDAEEALRTANQDLELRVRERTEELNAHKERLEELVLTRTSALEESHERLRQAERLATVGTLAAGLGHDMSNLLLPIRARVAGLSAGLSGRLSGPEAAADLAAIGEAAGYLQRLASGLRLLAVDPDRAEEHNQGTDLAVWWRDVEGIMRAAVPRNVRLEAKLRGGLPVVGISASRLTQAVFNLVQNAGEALASFPTGSDGKQGSVVLTASLPEGGTGGEVELCIEDNGPGMRAEVAGRCFEPYFSTKVRSVSTGMGLSMVRAWVEAAGGSVRLRTSPGKGTCFTVAVPTRKASAGGPGRALPVQVRAAISVGDARTADLVNSMVESASITAVAWRDGGVPEADVWVLEEANAVHLGAFLVGGRQRRAVVFTDPPSDSGAGGEGAPARSMERVRYVGMRPRSSELRRALKEALEQAGQRRATVHEPIIRTGLERTT